jgi:hypothetical protein
LHHTIESLPELGQQVKLLEAERGEDRAKRRKLEQDVISYQVEAEKRTSALAGRQGKTLDDGIPPLLQQISVSPASVPKAEDHFPLTMHKKDFGVMPTEEFKKISHNPARCWDDVEEDGNVGYASENDVAVLVNGLVKDIIKAMGLKFKTFTEVGTFGLRPDVWVVMWNMIPVGVIEVKKPDEDRKDLGQSILDKATVLGELFDFQMQLRNFYGMSPAFGILTTFEAWRVCWIPQNDADVDAIAKTDESLPTMVAQLTTPTKPRYATGNDPGPVDEKEESAPAKKTSPSGLTPSKANPMLHDIEDQDEDEDSGEETTALDQCSRVLHVSKIYHRTDEKHLAMRAIAAALCKMTKVTQSPFNNPFDKLKGRMVLRFTKGESRSIHWCRMGRLEGNGKWNKYAKPKKYLYAIEDLGHGANGRVWLTCTFSGAVCVLKFLMNDRESEHNGLECELENWKKAYPELKVFREKWCGREALRMPHFAAVRPDERLDVLDLVRTTLEANFYAKRLVHKDVTWRNIGLYKKVGAARSEAVVFDLGQVDHNQTAHDNDTNWVDMAIAKLKEEA